MAPRSEDAAGQNDRARAAPPGGESRPGRRPGFYYGWVILLAGFLLLYSGFGVQFSFGLFLPDIEAALAPGRRAVLSLAFALYLGLAGGFSVVSGIATDRWGPRPTVFAGALLAAGGLLWASQARALWEFFLGYGVIFALGMSVTWVPATSTVVKWFMARRGLAAGVVTAGVGAGQLTVPPLSALALEPLGWRTAHLVYALGLLAVFSLAALLLERDPESRGLRVEGAAPSPGADPQDDSFTLREALRTLPFWQFAVALSMLWAVVYLPAVHLPPFAKETLGLSSQAASFILTAIAVGSISSRLLGGAVSDLAGHYRTLVTAIALEVLAYLGMWATAVFEVTPLLYISAFLFGIGYGTVAALYAVILADLFGRRYASSISGAVYAMAGGATGLGVLLAGVLYQLTDGYAGAFLLGGLFVISSLPLFLMVRRPRRRATTRRQTAIP
jgi:MFS family permease